MVLFEGINNKIKVLKRNAYGYSNFTHFKNKILLMSTLFTPTTKKELSYLTLLNPSLKLFHQPYLTKSQKRLKHNGFSLLSSLLSCTFNDYSSSFFLANAGAANPNPPKIANTAGVKTFILAIPVFGNSCFATLACA